MLHAHYNSIYQINKLKEITCFAHHVYKIQLNLKIYIYNGEFKLHAKLTPEWQASYYGGLPPFK
jgi:hypothetical protein